MEVRAEEAASIGTTSPGQKVAVAGGALAQVDYSVGDIGHRCSHVLLVDDFLDRAAKAFPLRLE